MEKIILFFCFLITYIAGAQEIATNIPSRTLFQNIKSGFTPEDYWIQCKKNREFHYSWDMINGTYFRCYLNTQKYSLFPSYNEWGFLRTLDLISGDGVSLSNYGKLGEHLNPIIIELIETFGNPTINSWPKIEDLVENKFYVAYSFFKSRFIVSIYLYKYKNKIYHLIKIKDLNFHF